MGKTLATASPRWVTVSIPSGAGCFVNTGTCSANGVRPGGNKQKLMYEKRSKHRSSLEMRKAAKQERRGSAWCQV